MRGEDLEGWPLNLIFDGGTREDVVSSNCGGRLLFEKEGTIRGLNIGYWVCFWKGPLWDEGIPTRTEEEINVTLS